MGLLETVAGSVGVAAAKFLLKTYVGGGVTEALGGSCLELAGSVIRDYGSRWEAAHRFDAIGHQIALRLAPLFEREAQSGDLNVEAVALRLQATLEGRLSADFFLRRELDPARLSQELRRISPLPPGQFSSSETALYDRALDAVVRYLVEVASQLPRFQEAQAELSLARLAALQADTARLLEQMGRIEERVSRREGADREQRFEIDYLQAVVRHYDYMEILGADLPQEACRHPLSVAYVSLTAWSSNTGSESLPVAFEDLLDRGDTRRLLILGHAGSGKSTLLRWAAIEAARSREDAPPESWRARVPFLLRLRDLHAGELPPPDAFPGAAARLLGSPPTEWTASVLREGRALVLLDGVDEVPRFQREELRRQVDLLVRGYPECFFVVTSRPAAVPENWLGELEFQTVGINPLGDADRALFVRNWHRAVEEQLRRDRRPPESLEAMATLLIESLRSKPNLARLATNPLLCAAICALHRDRSRRRPGGPSGDVLPERSTELCEDLCRMLLYGREEESGLAHAVAPEGYRRLSYLERRSVVQELAYEMVLNSRSAISTPRAEEIILRTLPLLGATPTQDTVRDILRGLVERSGIIREATPDSLDFLHNTLKEYLAGDRFAKSGHDGLLAQHALDPAWQETILFAAATDLPNFASDLVERLLAGGVGSVVNKLLGGFDPVKSRKLFACQCGAVAMRVRPELRKRLDAFIQENPRPKSLSEAEEFSVLGDFVTPLLAYHPEMDLTHLRASARTLRLIGTEAARKVLQEYMEDPRPAIVAELVAAGNVASIGAVRRWLRGESALPPGIQELLPSPLDRAHVDENGRVEIVLEAPKGPGAFLSGFASPKRALRPFGMFDPLPEVAFNLGGLRGLRGLKELHLAPLRSLDLGPLAEVDVRRLSLGLRESETHPEAVDFPPGLQALTIVGLPTRPGHRPRLEFAKARGLRELEELVLFDVVVENLEVLQSLRTVRLIGPLSYPHQLEGAPSLVEVERYLAEPGPELDGELLAFGRCPQLERLRVDGSQVHNPSLPLWNLSGAARLQRLQIRAFELDLRPLMGLTALRELELEDVTLASPIDLSGLRRLVLVRTPLESLSQLRGLSCLTSLELADVGAEDLGPLAALPSLASLTLKGGDPARVKSLSEQRPDLKIYSRI